jgi:hypothetical protein
MRNVDLSLRYLGSPCYKGHSGWRYRRGGRCIECAQIIDRDRRALRSDAINDSRPKRRDEFKAAIERAVAHLYQAGLELLGAKDMGVTGWRQELSRHGLTQRTAAELRRFAYKKQTGEALPRIRRRVASTDWMDE